MEALGNGCFSLKTPLENNMAKGAVVEEIVNEEVVEEVTPVETSTEEIAVDDNHVTFRATRFPVRNPYNNTLYESDGEYEIADLQENTDNAKFVRVQLAAGVLTRV